MKFLIVDDHAVVREGVAAVLRAAAGDAAVLQAPDAATAMAVAAEHPDLDMVFLDLRMPGTGGLAALEEFGKRHPGLPVIVLSSSEDAGDVRRALALGALGYIPKSANSETFLAALRLVQAGQLYVPPFVVVGAGAARPNTGSGLAALTERQLEVLDLICADIGNKQIAYRLAISEKTVKAHVSAILKALGVTSRTQAARVARERS